ncbi:MOSC domain-containing protein [Asticcacaulis sp. YBE204]|uniref:MOSC domain-containing protein n=1 Tax=Asticcacaulis sp. YBE204 TaxID=1282363 RepID=UPI0003C3DAC6|nr:MOSC domain-containing protein [Asticcacaulis sp. YBE204]ESQ80646.1 hypothetical protein AEYBE204_05075 [Asticcacaulis sp. YBE204]
MPINPNSPLAALMNASMRPGTIEWIGLRPVRRGEIDSVAEAVLDSKAGLIGDHYKSATRGTRHLTLIGHEDLHAIGSYLGTVVLPEQLRRNVLTSGINLLALKDKRFRLGEAVLEMTGECHPCSRMEEILGIGGYNAVRGHGGITAQVLEGGTIRLGDALTVVT